MSLQAETERALIADYRATILERMDGGVSTGADLRARHAVAVRDVLEAHGLVGCRDAERLLGGQMLTLLEGSIRMLERDGRTE